MTNTSVLCLALCLAVFFSISAAKFPSGGDAAEPWKLAYKENGLLVFYDIRDCTPATYMLFFKIINNNASQQRVAFSARIGNGGSFDSETFHIQKMLKSYATEMADCSDKTGKTGLIRPLKRTYDDPEVTISME